MDKIIHNVLFKDEFDEKSFSEELLANDRLEEQAKTQLKHEKQLEKQKEENMNNNGYQDPTAGLGAAFEQYAESQEFKNLPAGIYPVTLDVARIKLNSQSKPMGTFGFKVLDGPSKGKKAFANFNFKSFDGESWNSSKLGKFAKMYGRLTGQPDNSKENTAAVTNLIAQFVQSGEKLQVLPMQANGNLTIEDKTFTNESGTDIKFQELDFKAFLNQ